MIAQATIDYSYAWVGWLVVGLGVLVLSINQLDDFFDRRKTKQGQPPNEQLQQSLDSMQKEMQRNWQEHRDLFSKIGGVERGAAANLQKAIESGNISRENLHKRINDLLVAISKLQGRLEK
jgi:hypothetical protein